MPDDKVIKSLHDGKSYKYLGILEADRFFRREDKVECFEGIYYKVKKCFEVKTEWWEFRSWS